MNDDAGRERQEREIADAWREAVGREAPPPALDARILGAAHEAVAGASRAAGHARRRPRALAPLALAASVIVAVGLGLHQQRASSPPAAAKAARDEERAAIHGDALTPAVRDAQQAPPPVAAQRAPAPDSQTAEPAQEGAGVSAAAKASGAEAAPPGFARERRAAAPDAPAAAKAPLPADANAAVEDVVARIRALLARGEREAAARLAREHAARHALPADLEFLLAPIPP